MTIDSSQNVGIGQGATSPVGNLDVAVNTAGSRRFEVSYENSIVSLLATGGGAGSTRIENLGIYGDSIKFYTDDTTSTAMTIDSSQRVGIGVTSPETPLAFEPSDTTTATEGIKFQNSSITSDAIVQPWKFASGMGLILGSNFYIDTSGNVNRFNSSEESSGILIDPRGTLTFSTGGTGANATTALTIDSSQNVKVNTGALQLNDVAQSIDFLQSGAINFDSNNDQTGRVLTIGCNRANGATGGTTIATFTEDANVGIGTTSPAYKLDLVSSEAIVSQFTGSSGETILSLDNTSTNGDKWYLISGGSGGSFSGGKFGIYNADTTTAVATFTNDGNVGIGTTSPATKIDVGSTSDGSGVIASFRGDGFTTRLDHTSNVAHLYTGGSSNSLTFGTNSTERMRILSDGNVCLGRTSVLSGLGDGRTTLAIAGTGSADYAALQLGNYGTSGNDQGLGFIGFFDGTSRNALIGAYRESGTGDANIKFFTSASSGSVSERMRINSVGYLNLASGCEVGSHATEGVTVNGSSGAYTTVLTFSESGGGRGKYLVTGVQQGVGVGTAFEIIIGVSTASAIYLYESIDLNSMSINISGNSLQARHEASTSTIVINVNAIPLCLHGN